jgi:hypothetical protein
MPQVQVCGIVEERSIRDEAEGKLTVDRMEVIMRT